MRYSTPLKLSSSRQSSRLNVSAVLRARLRPMEGTRTFWNRLAHIGLLIALAGAAWVGATVVAADPRASIAVLYPDMEEPYRSVFTQIITGVEKETGTPVNSYPIGPGHNPQELSNRLQQRDVRIVITLGRSGLSAATGLKKEVGIIAGGILSAPAQSPQNLSVLSLAPDPALLFKQLKALAPGIKRVLVVHDPQQNAWLMQLAREAASAQGLDLQIREASDLKSALQTYKTLLAEANPKLDALWLPQDSTTVEESTILPLILQEAWSHGLLFFSSSVVHVKRGALFALYPDNEGLGRRLASSALKQLSGTSQSPAALSPLRDVLLAVNIRTASHLGLDLSDSRYKFDMIFPAP
ncbi:MAG: hypothetical protein EPO06_03630 [Burkholderiaceae bacterium]|nr:MAG: hypothetical protein EPO06_03630 [Burkholderiaceae bacterium]